MVCSGQQALSGFIQFILDEKLVFSDLHIPFPSSE
jgi:hypothetical protein